MRRVIIDGPKRTIRFENCFVSKSFFALWTMKEFECSFGDILDVHDFLKTYRFYGPYLPKIKIRTIVIVTTQGKAELSEKFTNFDEARSIFLELSSINPRGPRLDNPNVVLGLIKAIFLLIVLGCI